MVFENKRDTDSTHCSQTLCKHCANLRIDLLLKMISRRFKYGRSYDRNCRKIKHSSHSTVQFNGTPNSRSLNRKDDGGLFLGKFAHPYCVPWRSLMDWCFGRLCQCLVCEYWFFFYRNTKKNIDEDTCVKC